MSKARSSAKCSIQKPDPAPAGAHDQRTQNGVHKLEEALWEANYMFDLYSAEQFPKIKEHLQAAAQHLAIALEAVAGPMSVISSKHRNERHDPHRSFGNDQTILQSMEAKEFMLYRSDIMLINVYGKDQFSVYASSRQRGEIFTPNHQTFNYLTDDDIAWAKNEAALIWDAAQEFPIFGRHMLSTPHGDERYVR